MRIVIPGGSGQAGMVLACAFHERGHAVSFGADQHDHVARRPVPVGSRR